MKRFCVLSSFLFFGIVVYSQDCSFNKNENGEYEFSEVVESNLSKSTLFKNATSWAMDYFKEEGFNNVVEYCSETEGRIIIKYIDLILNNVEIKKGISHFGKENLYFTLTIDCKDNKYRYIINDIIIKELAYFPLYGNDMEYDMTHEKHIEMIDAYKHEKDSLNSLKPNLKGKKLSKLQNQIDEVDDKIKGEMEMYNDEYLVINRLIKSLKKEMAKNSDF